MQRGSCRVLRCELQQGWAPPKPPPGQVDPGSLQRTEIPGLSQGKIPASTELRAGDSRTVALLEPGSGFWDQERGCHSHGAGRGYPGSDGTFGPSPTPRRAGGHWCGFVVLHPPARKMPPWNALCELLPLGLSSLGRAGLRCPRGSAGSWGQDVQARRRLGWDKPCRRCCCSCS